MLPTGIKAIILCLLMGATSVQAQDSLFYMRLNIPEAQHSIESAIKIIEQQTGLSFSYNSELINKKQLVTLSARNMPLIDLLHQLFKDPSLYYTIMGKHLVIYRPVRTITANPERNQDTVMFFIVSGRVVDQESQLPLPFCSVYLVGKTIGTISNEEGEFQLKLDASELTETLSISCIGYRNFSAPVSALVGTKKDYYLNTDIIPIQEVVIRRVSPYLLLQNTRNRIRANYPLKPTILTAFYRETIQRGSRYTMVSEAILENYKCGYGNIVSDKVKILKGRKNEDFQRDDTVMLKLKAGLGTMLLLDVVKNIPDFLTPEGQSDYTYRLTDIVIEDGRDNFVIDFTPKVGSRNRPIYSGKILIDVKDMAYKWVEFHVDPPQLDEATAQFIIRKPSNLVVKTLHADYKVSFRKSGNKYYMNMVQCETGFKIRNRHQLTGSIYKTRLEMAVIGIDSTNVNRFSPKEVARPYEFFTDQLGVYDESFWGEYNFIKPDESLETALAKLKRTQEAKKEQ